MTKGQIAPHEGREIELVLTGKKPLAVIEKRKNPEAYTKAGSLEGVITVYRTGEEGPEVIISRRARLIREYLFLLYEGVKTYGLKEYHRKMGRLFGYSDADIEAFIGSIQCECSKCRGAQERKKARKG
tara:strand:- start:3151 stop:3534 length:384 start_codon:yes stop_codon:yes gene_type:complete